MTFLLFIRDLVQYSMSALIFCFFQLNAHIRRAHAIRTGRPADTTIEAMYISARIDGGRGREEEEE